MLHPVVWIARARADEFTLRMSLCLHPEGQDYYKEKRLKSSRDLRASPIEDPSIQKELDIY